MTPPRATALVFTTSAAVLVLEILAGRLLAPYVGISLETFTGIIGTMLAGIAVGAWAGGALADTRDPAPLVGPTIAVGGALAWLSLPIVDALGPELGAGPGSIIVLTAAAFFAPGRSAHRREPDDRQAPPAQPRRDRCRRRRACPPRARWGRWPGRSSPGSCWWPRRPCGRW